MATIPAQSWNQLYARVRSARPLSGSGVTVVSTPSGCFVSADPANGFEHPWKISSRWHEGQWRVFVRPGFVNGLDATIATQRDGKQKDVGLTDPDRPFLTPAWRNPLLSPGMKASSAGDLFSLPAEGYPKFFESLGVRPPDPGSRQPAPFDPQSAEERTREIRACDIVLVTPRVATSQSVEIHDPFSESQTVSISTTFNDSYARSAGSKHQLVAVAKWEPPKEPTPMERLLGLAVEPQTDEIKIATLWMVSPPNPEGGENAEPDGAWMAYPQYDVFWNLAHAPRREVPAAPPKPITLRTGLVGGLADAIFAALLAPVNDASSRIHSFLNATTFKGDYWTA